ncbi:ExbD/TolR family protein [Aurantiacibacter aquimixticola]|uniref:Uncharacterized protein n=1 Tax=Aurantiacibacter aquimixticola TaxID=1958945 RepID=A0A419RV76_9SPHN|nr:biopolymer transporter ExbD [Aurantiacibacter aquimixticola]RJY09654.1 hypothetical protein D6201_10065 [Aurantiacibacter aquimixticola]
MVIWVDAPMQTHALEVDIPTTGPLSLPPEAWDLSDDALVNVVVPKEDGTIQWNGETVSERELRKQLTGNLMLPVEPSLVFAPDPNASYELSLRVLSLVKRSGANKFCFGDLDDHRHFDSDSLRLMITRTPNDTSIVVEPIERVAPLAETPACASPNR